VSINISSLRRTLLWAVSSANRKHEQEFAPRRRFFGVHRNANRSNNLFVGEVEAQVGTHTARLIYINIAIAGVAEHRQSGMYIGFLAFPAAVVIFGWLSLKCWRGL
jgi:hypothetical protein